MDGHCGLPDNHLGEGSVLHAGSDSPLESLNGQRFALSLSKAGWRHPSHDNPHGQ